MKINSIVQKNTVNEAPSAAAMGYAGELDFARSSATQPKQERVGLQDVATGKIARSFNKDAQGIQMLRNLVSGMSPDQKKKYKIVPIYETKLSESNGGTCSASIAAGPAQNLLAQPQKRVKENTGVTDYNPPSQGGTRSELLAQLRKDPTNKGLLSRARKAGATQTELMKAISTKNKKVTESVKEQEEKKQVNESRVAYICSFNKNGKRYSLWQKGDYWYELTHSSQGNDGSFKHIAEWGDKSLEDVKAEIESKGFVQEANESADYQTHLDIYKHIDRNTTGSKDYKTRGQATNKANAVLNKADKRDNPEKFAGGRMSGPSSNPTVPGTNRAYWGESKEVNEWASGGDKEKYQQQMADFLKKGGQVQKGKAHAPRKAEKWQGSAHIGKGDAGGKAGQQTGRGANVNKPGQAGKPVVAASKENNSKPVNEAPMKPVRSYKVSSPDDPAVKAKARNAARAASSKETRLAGLRTEPIEIYADELERIQQNSGVGMGGRVEDFNVDKRGTIEKDGVKVAAVKVTVYVDVDLADMYDQQTIDQMYNGETHTIESFNALVYRDPQNPRKLRMSW